MRHGAVCLQRYGGRGVLRVLNVRAFWRRWLDGDRFTSRASWNAGGNVATILMRKFAARGPKHQRTSKLRSRRRHHHGVFGNKRGCGKSGLTQAPRCTGGRGVEFVRQRKVQRIRRRRQMRSASGSASGGAHSTVRIPSPHKMSWSSGPLVYKVPVLWFVGWLLEARELTGIDDVLRRLLREDNTACSLTEVALIQSRHVVLGRAWRWNGSCVGHLRA